MSTFDSILKSGSFPGAYVFHIAGMPWAATNSPALKVYLDAGGATATALKKKMFGIKDGSENPPAVEILSILDNDIGSQRIDFGQDKGIRVGDWSVKLKGDNGAGFSWNNGGAFVPHGILGLTWQPAFDYTDPDGSQYGAAWSVLYDDAKPGTAATPNAFTLKWPQEKDFGLKGWLDDNWNGGSYDKPCDLWCSNSCWRAFGEPTAVGSTHYSVSVYSGIYNTPNEWVHAVREEQNIYVTNYPQSINGQPAYLYAVELDADGNVNSGTTPFTLRTGRVKPGTRDNGSGTWTVGCTGATDQLKVKAQAPRFTGHMRKYHFNDNDLEVRSHAYHMWICESSNGSVEYKSKEVTLSTTNGHVIYDTADDLRDAVKTALDALTVAGTLSGTYEWKNGDLVLDSGADWAVVGGIVPWVLGIGYIHWADMERWIDSVFSLAGNPEFEPWTDDANTPIIGGERVRNAGDSADVFRFFGGPMLKAYLRTDDGVGYSWEPSGSGQKLVRNFAYSPYFVQYDLNDSYRYSPFRPYPQVPQTSNVDATRKVDIQGTIGNLGGLEDDSLLAFGPPFTDTKQRFSLLEDSTAARTYLEIGSFDGYDGYMSNAPWGMAWASLLADALQDNQDYIEAFNDVANSSYDPIRFNSSSSRQARPALTSVTTSTVGAAADVVQTYYMGDPFAITDCTTVRSTSPVSLLKDLLGDKDVASTGISSAIKQTNTTDLVDRGQYNHLEMIDWTALQTIVNEAGLDGAEYTLKLRDPEATDADVDNLDFDIVDLLQAVALTHGGRMVWEWNETKRSYRIGFISEGGESLAQARVKGQVIESGEVLLDAPSSGVDGGDWYYATISTELQRQDGGTEKFNVKNRDGRISHTLKDKAFKYTDQMTLLPTFNTSARAELERRYADYQQLFARVQYKHTLPVKLSAMRRIEAGKSVIFSADAALDRVQGKRNNGAMLGQVRGINVNLGGKPSVNVDLIVSPGKDYGIGPSLYISNPVQGVGNSYTVSGLSDDPADNKFGNPGDAVLTDLCYFACLDNIDGTLTDRGCGCGDYAITIFERGTDTLQWDPTYSLGAQNVFRGTIQVNSADLTGCTFEIGGNDDAFNTVNGDNGEWVIVFSNRDDSNLVSGQTNYYGWLGKLTSGGRCEDSGGNKHPAIKVSL